MAIKSDWDKKPLQQNLHGTSTIAEYNYKCIIYLYIRLSTVKLQGLENLTIVFNWLFLYKSLKE